MWPTAKTHNACLALIELAKRSTNSQPVALKTIADEQTISSQFLVQIFLQLKRAGLVTSTRGVSGGYRLAKSPDKISLLEIVKATSGIAETPPLQSSTPAAIATRDAWQKLIDSHIERLAGVSLEDLVSQTWTDADNMYHI